MFTNNTCLFNTGNFIILNTVSGIYKLDVNVIEKSL